MGCNCKKVKKDNKIYNERPNPQSLIMRYIFCPKCNKVTPKRIEEKYLMSHRCSICNTRTTYFNRSPSVKRLKLVRQQKGYYNE
jgi:hypothetical protein